MQYVCTIGSVPVACNNPVLRGPARVGSPRPDRSLNLRRPPAHEEQPYRGFRSGHSAFDCLALSEFLENFWRKPSGQAQDECNCL